MHLANVAPGTEGGSGTGQDYRTYRQIRIGIGGESLEVAKQIIAVKCISRCRIVERGDQNVAVTGQMQPSALGLSVDRRIVSALLTPPLTLAALAR